MSYVRNACIVLACMMAACGIAIVAGAAGPWHPPGEDQPEEFKCQSMAGGKWRCEAFHVKQVPFPNAWPQWELYPEDGPRCDYDEGMVVYMKPFKGQAHLVIMKPNTNPKSWRQAWIMNEHRRRIDP